MVKMSLSRFQGLELCGQGQPITQVAEELGEGSGAPRASIKARDPLC